MAEDEGVYTCRAENAVGAVEGSVSLIVHGEILRVNIRNFRIEESNQI